MWVYAFSGVFLLLEMFARDCSQGRGRGLIEDLILPLKWELLLRSWVCLQSGAACGRWRESRTSSPDADEEDVGLDTARTEVVFHGKALESW